MPVYFTFVVSVLSLAGIRSYCKGDQINSKKMRKATRTESSCSLRYYCQTDESSVLPLCSLWGAATTMRPPFSSSNLGCTNPGVCAQATSVQPGPHIKHCSFNDWRYERGSVHVISSVHTFIIDLFNIHKDHRDPILALMSCIHFLNNGNNCSYFHNLFYSIYFTVFSG